MFDSYTNEVKIIDFGFAVTTKEKLRDYYGTPSYMSPQIIARREYFGPKADIWAVGVMMFTLLVGHLPFDSGSERELYYKICRGAYSFQKAAISH